MRAFVGLVGAVLGLAAVLGPPAPAAAGEPPPPASEPAAPSADPFAGLPKEVAVAVKELEEECRAEHGVPRWTAHALFGPVNVSPDGRPDYLINTHGIECVGNSTPWIGSDGFRYIVIVSTGKGKWVRAFDRSARGFEITEGKDPRIILFSHSGDCTRPNPKRYQRCTQDYAWRHGKLKLMSEEWETD